MVKITTMPKETAVELLHFIAENERFPSVETKLEGGFTVPQVRALLREIAGAITEDESSEARMHERLRVSSELSARTKDIISSLTPEEEHRLLSAFGLVSK